jgi:4'-phosphopantetheinyl transferase
MLTLAAGEVHIWTARLPSTNASHLYSDLSGAERDRVYRLRFSRDRWAYVFAHAVLRDVLSQYLHCPPGPLEFSANVFGKPSLAKTADGWTPEFNLSRAGSLVVVALSADRFIGVDVEEIRPVSEFSLIAESYFTPEECTFIWHHAATDRERAFFRCWTRKEAYIKAVGKGLSIALNSFDTLIPSGQAGRRLPGGTDAPNVGEWWLTDLEVPEGYIGAVAVETCIDRLIYFEWSSGRRNVTGLVRA